MPAMLGSLTASMIPIGARDLSVLVPGAVVLCWISDKYYAVIISVLTSPMGSSQMVWPDSLVAVGHAGLFADSAHNQLITAGETANGFLDFSAGGPIDSLPGDWGHLNELGMGFFLGRLMAFMRAGELCKFEMHYADMLARLYAYNWQHYTAGSEDEAFDDEGEWTRIRGFSPYPWEAAGVGDDYTGAFNKSDSLEPKNALDRFGLEPGDDKTVMPLQGSFVRYKEFEGFLGDLRRRFVVMLNKPDGNVPRRLYGRKKSDPAQYKGLLEEVIGLDGGYLLRSAKGIGFEKTIWIPVPEEAYPRDNPNGDHDFMAAGKDMTFTEYPAQASPGAALARIRDEQSHDLNKRRSEPLNQRDKDWLFRDDTVAANGAISTPGNYANEQPPLSAYSSYEQALPAPATEEVAPTGARTSQYYQGKAFMGILPDGSILLRDAYGSEIRLCGGNIELSCPGDVSIRNGRTLQVWGGRDVILKAHKSLELSSANSNVRIKAENNLEVLGGNNGSGGVLIESRSPLNTTGFQNIGDSASFGGLILKNSKGTVGIWGAGLYLNSMTSGVVIDAAGNTGGNGNFVVYAGRAEFMLQGAFQATVAPKGKDNTYEQANVLVHDGSGLGYYGGAVEFGAASFTMFNHRGSGAGLATAINMKANMSLDGAISAAGFNPAQASDPSAFSGAKASATNITKAANTSYLENYAIYIGGDNAFGNKAIYKLIGFSFRPSSTLNLGSMIIYETEWQKRFRQTAGKTAGEKYNGSVWAEPDVPAWVDATDPKALGQLTKPFPGKEAWDGALTPPAKVMDAKYVRVDDQFYVSDSAGGKPLPRGIKGVAYKTVTPPPFNGKDSPAPTDEAFKDRYPING
jgi:hypothetical protein